MTFSSHWLELGLTNTLKQLLFQCRDISTIQQGRSNACCLLVPIQRQWRNPLVSSQIRSGWTPLSQKVCFNEKATHRGNEAATTTLSFRCRSTSLGFWFNIARSMIDVFFSLIRVGVDRYVETALVPVSWQWRFVPLIRVGVDCNIETALISMHLFTDQSWGWPLVLSPIRVRVDHDIGTALVSISWRFPPIRVGVNLLFFHRSELGLTMILEQLLSQYPGDLHRSELGLTSYFSTDQS